MATLSVGLRLIQTAATRSHVPLIRFPERIPLPKRFPMLEKLKEIVIQKSTAANGIITKPNRVVCETVDEVPEQYRRPRISEDECIYIEHGGPVD